MIRLPRSLPRFAGWIGCALLTALAACSTPRPTASNDAVAFDRAVGLAVDGLAQQLTAGVFGSIGRRVAVLDPTLDAGSGQQTVATQFFDRQIAQRLPADVLPLEAANLPKAKYLLTGTLSRAPDGYRLNLAMVELASGKVAAQSSSVARADGVDMNPLPYYRDSPVLVRDKVVDGLVKTAATAPGQPADATYLERIAAATLINDAAQLYNAARYREALAQYRSVRATPAGEQIRVLTGIYMSTLRLGQTAEAEDAFGRLVAYGIGSNNLSVKFLFNPGSTDFWSDPKVSGPYGMWLRQIARQSNAARACLDIVGHTSKTGTEANNDALSQRRALYIRQRLGAESPDLARRSRTQGVGARQPIVGSGTDDVVDAPDRRVEFLIVDCAR